MTKELSDILFKVSLVATSGNMNLPLSGIVFDSRKVYPGCVFIAIKGTTVDGHQYIAQAIAAGAAAIVCEYVPDGLNIESQPATMVVVKNSAEALGIMAANWYGNPSQKLKVIGVTGTNGKTTTVTLLYTLFTNLGYKCGLLSTVENKIGEQTLPATHTTPDAHTIQQLMAEMVKQGCTHCFMEVSSHAVVQHRISGIQFTGAVFTNITPEHLDFHGSFQNYILAKKGFFDMLDSQAFALINADDKHAKIMVQNTKAFVRSYSLQHATDYHARILANGVHGLQLEIEGREMWSRLMGKFNASNLLCVYAVSQLLGEPAEEVCYQLSALMPPKGRFERYFSEDGITAIVDYAHTPDALKNVLDTIQQIRTGNEKVITVVGCGGDRDKTKRPLMAAIASKGSNLVVLTSDNPRSEDPEAIIDDMMTGISAVDYKKIRRITDRHEAIAYACKEARPGDIILIAGKGHETYQEIKGVKYPFDDGAEVKRYLKIKS